MGFKHVIRLPACGHFSWPRRHLVIQFGKCQQGALLHSIRIQGKKRRKSRQYTSYSEHTLPRWSPLYQPPSQRGKGQRGRELPHPTSLCLPTRKNNSARRYCEPGDGIVHYFQGLIKRDIIGFLKLVTSQFITRYAF